MKVYRVCWTTYGQSYVRANSISEAEHLAFEKFQKKGAPDICDTRNDWEMVDETEEVDCSEMLYNPIFKLLAEEKL
jgi:hypothetical protein